MFRSAIDIVTLVVTRTVGLDPQSIEQLSYTYIFTEVIAHGGLVTATFMLFTPHLVDVCLWYVFIFSSVSVALSTAILVTTGRLNPFQASLLDMSFSALTGNPPTCNSWRLGAYCYSSFGLTPSLFKWRH